MRLVCPSKNDGFRRDGVKRPRPDIEPHRADHPSVMGQQSGDGTFLQGLGTKASGLPASSGFNCLPLKLMKNGPGWPMEVVR